MQKQNKKSDVQHQKKYRKSGSIALCMALSAVLCATAAFGRPAVLQAADGDNLAYKDVVEQQAATEAQKKLFTLKDIQDMARSRGIETLNAKSDLAIAQAAKEAADMSVYDAWYNSAQVGAIASETAIAMAVASQEEAILSLDDAKAKAESQMEAAVYAGEELYFTYGQLQDGIALLEKTIALSQEQVRLEQLKFTLGLSTATEVQKKELALSELNENLESLKHSLELSGRSLLRQIGQETDLKFRLDREFSIEGLKEVYDPGQLADLAVKNNLDLAVAARTIDKLQDTLENVLAPISRGQLGSRIDAIILAKSNGEQSIRLLARSTAGGLELSRQEISLLEKKVAEKTTDYETTKLQASLGLAPRLVLQGAELELETAKNDLAKARQDYYLSLRRASLLVKGVAVTARASG
jgi:outer membrane protein TolC